jgi:hypothetical protein
MQPHPQMSVTHTNLKGPPIMDEIGTSSCKPVRRHLHAPGSVTRAVHSSTAVDLTRSHGQSNGLRVHRIYFAAVSLAGLMLVIGAVALAATMR